jgi:hypothetical protein
MLDESGAVQNQRNLLNIVPGPRVGHRRERTEIVGFSGYKDDIGRPALDHAQPDPLEIVM